MSVTDLFELAGSLVSFLGLGLCYARALSDADMKKYRKK